VLVAWYETQLCEGCVSPGFIRVAVQPAGATRFRREQVLEREATGLQGAPIGTSLAPLFIAVGGSAPMVVFVARGETQPASSQLIPAVVKVAYPKGLGFTAPQMISPADQEAGDIGAAAGPNGAIVTWVREDPPSYYAGTVFAAVRLRANAVFGPPEQVSPSEHVLSAVPAFTAASRWPRNSIAPWMVAWTSRPVTEASTVVRVSAPLCPGESLPAPSRPSKRADQACFGA
jgi:hypothetical protein